MFLCPNRKLKTKELSAEEVRKYLKTHPKVVEEYLLKSSSIEFLEKLIKQKKKLVGQNVFDNLRSDSTAKKYFHRDSVSTIFTDTGMKAMCRKIVSCIQDEDIYKQIFDICQIISAAMEAEACLVFIMENTEVDLALYTPETGPLHLGPIEPSYTVPAYVAVEGRTLVVSNVHKDRRFPLGVCSNKYKECHALCIPILLDSGSVYCVIEFIRTKLERTFDEYDFEMATGIFSWIMACVQKMKLNRMLKIQEALNNFLLETTKVMFDDMENIDLLITNIMTFTKDLVCADRCSLFLVDDERDELYADYFDEGKMSTEGLPIYTKKSQIRFPRDKGIAGFVARTGEVVNIKDAYKDDRFNTDIDKRTGYTTRNILCMPINGKDGVLGVVQMINRKNGDHFTLEDESAFKLFAIYCALALHYSRIYTLLSHKHMKYQVAMDVLNYHISCSDDEYKALLKAPEIAENLIPADFDTYDFCCYDYTEHLPKLFIKLIQETFTNTFEMRKLCRFILTVRKNYRPVQYHNWEHGFHVGHSLWQMIRKCKFQFTNLEKMALIIGGVCHDIDHRGYNNDFFKKLKLPLAALYSTSLMEEHHYKQMITILHAEGHEIFSFLTADEHRLILDYIRKNIIATDLSLYFTNQKFLTGLIERKEFNPEVGAHRHGLLALMMTGADLCAIAKPWHTQQRTAKFIYDEFFMQGDEEKKRGLQPIPMMDRHYQDDIPKNQIGFISFICKPLYTTLSVLLPGTKRLLDGTITSMDKWKVEMEEQKAAREKATKEQSARAE